MQLTSKLALIALSGSVVLTPAHAGSRTWVSNTGTDSGTCLVTAPCRTFQYAHDHTSAGGEIDVKDSGGFGQLTINKAITVVAPDGVLATIGIANANGTGVQISAASNDNVTLRGLSINGYNSGSQTYGISISSGTVTLDHLNLFGNGVGIAVDNTTNTYISNCLFAGNASGITTYYTGTVYLASNLFTNNQTALANTSGAPILSYHNNDAGSGTVSSVTQVSPF